MNPRRSPEEYPPEVRRYRYLLTDESLGILLMAIADLKAYRLNNGGWSEARQLVLVLEVLGHQIGLAILRFPRTLWNATLSPFKPLRRKPSLSLLHDLAAFLSPAKRRDFQIRLGDAQVLIQDFHKQHKYIFARALQLQEVLGFIRTALKGHKRWLITLGMFLYSVVQWFCQ